MAVFVKLQSLEQPFDTALFIFLNSDGKPTNEERRSSLRETRFRALVRSEDEQRDIVNVVLEELRISNADI